MTPVAVNKHVINWGESDLNTSQHQRGGVESICVS